MASSFKEDSEVYFLLIPLAQGARAGGLPFASQLTVGLLMDTTAIKVVLRMGSPSQQHLWLPAPSLRTTAPCSLKTEAVIYSSMSQNPGDIWHAHSQCLFNDSVSLISGTTTALTILKHAGPLCCKEFCFSSC